jgi:hypothetical protein
MSGILFFWRWERGGRRAKRSRDVTTASENTRPSKSKHSVLLLSQKPAGAKQQLPGGTLGFFYLVFFLFTRNHIYRRARTDVGRALRRTRGPFRVVRKP